jgi:exopolysaccharide biosynthesis polyprenyl glycosylphosphotransferase
MTDTRGFRVIRGAAGTPPGVASGDATAPSLDIRRQVRARRPVTVRRHSTRLSARFFVLFLGDIAALLVYQAIATLFRDVSVRDNLFGAHGALPGPAAGWNFALALLLSLLSTGSYSRHRLTNSASRLFTAASLGAGLALVYWLVRGVVTGWPAVFVMAATLLLTWIVLVAERRVTERFLRTVWPRDQGTIPALFIRCGSSLDELLEHAVVSHGGDYRKAGQISLVPGEEHAHGAGLGTLPDLIQKNGIETIVICGELPTSQLEYVVDAGLHAACQILSPARAVHLRGVSPRLVWHKDQPFLELGAPVLKATAVILKRIVDILGAVIALVIISPVLVLIGIAIKIDSPGPVFFLQKRAGLGGHSFNMLKFRTMRLGADEEKESLSHLNATGDPRLFKIHKDPRVTRLGEFLRRWSIDELPQLFNVLGGSMSLVGPRPFFESDFSSYEDHHFRRLDAKPGITGLWQVSGRSAVVDFEDVVYLDRQYIEQWSFWLDVSIIFRTIPAVLRGTGAF